MAAHANSTTVPTIATALAMQADAVSKTKIKTVQNLAGVLATLMQDIHGGSWRVDISHEAGTALVLIRQSCDKAISKPERGEVA